MGIFSPTPTSTIQSPAPSLDGAYIAPDRSARVKCWEARDGFFACLDRNNIVDSIKDKEAASNACGTEQKLLERDCASSWVTYFKQRKVMEYNKAKTLERLKAEGARPMPEGVGPPGQRSSVGSS